MRFSEDGGRVRRRRTSRGFVLTRVLCGVACLPALVATASPTLTRHVIAAGGGTASSPQFTMNITIGQAVAGGPLVANNHSLYAGFWAEQSSACSRADITSQNAPVGDPRYGMPDGLVTAADIQFYVNLWVAEDPAADWTSQNAPIGDPNHGVPDGLVTGADIQFYVNMWIAGCP